jgi:flavin-dependent dehydrogenase
VLHRWSNRFVFGCPTDSGLYLAIVMPELAELDRFRSDLERSYMEHVLSCEPVARAVGDATRVGKILGAVRWEGFFREASGPGWVLTGDAGHFKDPAPGRGIGDAFRQAEALAPAIVSGLRGPDQELDRALDAWGRWRDHDFAEHYWFGSDLGSAGPLPAAAREMVRRLQARGELDLFLDIQNHRVKPSSVLTPPRLLAATARLLLRRGSDRPRVLRELGTLLTQEAHRRWLNRRPAYAPAGAADAGPTEVD